MAGDIRVCTRVIRHFAQLRQVGQAGTIDDNQQRQDHPDKHALQHTDQDHASKCQHTQYEFRARHQAGGMQLACSDRVPEGIDNQGCQDRFGQVRKERREEQERQYHCDPGDETDDLRASTSVVVHRRRRHAAARNLPAEQAGGEIDNGKGIQFLVRINFIAVLIGVVLSNAQRLAERDKQDPDGRRDHK